jgi:hypothetical protein
MQPIAPYGAGADLVDPMIEEQVGQSINAVFSHLEEWSYSEVHKSSGGRGCLLLTRRLVDGDVSTLADGLEPEADAPHQVME